jgi:hypothetical protein
VRPLSPRDRLQLLGGSLGISAQHRLFRGHGWPPRG